MKSTCWFAAIALQVALFGILLAMLFVPTIDTEGIEFNLTAADGKTYTPTWQSNKVDCTGDTDDDPLLNKLVGEQQQAQKDRIRSVLTFVDGGACEMSPSRKSGGFPDDCTGTKTQRCPYWDELENLVANYDVNGAVDTSNPAPPSHDLTTMTSRYNQRVINNDDFAKYFRGQTLPKYEEDSTAYADRVGPHLTKEETTADLVPQMFTEGVLLWVAIGLTVITTILLAVEPVEANWLPGSGSTPLRAVGTLTNLLLLATFATFVATMADDGPNTGAADLMLLTPQYDASFTGTDHYPELLDEVSTRLFIESSRKASVEAMVLGISGLVLLTANVGVWARPDSGNGGYTVLGFLHL
jgi:hypothetical protein